VICVARWWRRGPTPLPPDLARALHNLANHLSALGRREDALAAAEEACDLYAALAAARPDAFTPDLAVALAVLAKCLEQARQTGDALATNREAITALRAPFLAHPAAFAHWMAPMCQQYIERSERLGRDPDAELLGLITEALRQMEDSSGEAEGADRLP
jgi:tetratricopeptide (TPR) repeat protein